MAERLALPTSDHRVTGSNLAGGEILPEPKRRFIAQSLSCSLFHRLEMTEILLKGRKTLTHPSIFFITHFSVLFQDESLRWRILTLSSYSHFAQGHIPYLFSTYIPCAILELSGTIPELADRVRILSLRRTIPELYRFLLCTEHVNSKVTYLLRGTS